MLYIRSATGHEHLKLVTQVKIQDITCFNDKNDNVDYYNKTYVKGQHGEYRNRKTLVCNLF